MRQRQGVEWLLLTNGHELACLSNHFRAADWPQELVIEFDFCALPPKNDFAPRIGSYLLTKEGLSKSVLDEYHTQRQAMNRFFSGAMVLSDTVLEIVRRELRPRARLA